MSDSLQPCGLYSPWNSPGRMLEWVAFPFSRGSSQPRDQAQVSHIAGGFFTSWATREAQDNSLLQGIFLTQGLNPGLPHCRWTLYQLSHKGSPRIPIELWEKPKCSINYIQQLFHLPENCRMRSCLLLSRVTLCYLLDCSLARLFWEDSLLQEIFPT